MIFALIDIQGIYALWIKIILIQLIELTKYWYLEMYLKTNLYLHWRIDG